MSDDNPIVVFDPDEFRTLKPQFAESSDEALHGYFSEAELLLWGTAFENKPSSRYPCKYRKALLYALTCHLATLIRQAADSGGMSGSIASASEGSVSVSFATKTPTGDLNADWLNGTECGAYALMLLKRHRGSPRLFLGPRGCI